MMGSWFVLLFWVAFWLLPSATVISLAVEDGFIEDLGAAAFFVAAVLFFVSFLRSGDAERPSAYSRMRNPWLLLLAVAFFFGAGEEISWGQRVFGWETPEAIAEINAQNETTIHNLDLFQQGKSFSFWFNAFWLGFCVVTPILVMWPLARRLVDAVRVPVVPLWSGLLLLSNYAVFKLVASTHPSGSELRHAANELKETTIALVFVWIAWILFEAVRGSAPDPSLVSSVDVAGSDPAGSMRRDLDR